MAQTNDQNLSQIIAQWVDRLVGQRVQKAPYDRTYGGIISAILFTPETRKDDVLFGQYKVRFGNTEKKVKLIDGIVHEVGERVNVTVCGNDPNRIIYEPVVRKTYPTKINWDKDNGGDADKSKMTFTRKVTTNGSTYDSAREYTIEFKNKGEDNEEPVKITLPDGQEIELEGFLQE